MKMAVFWKGTLLRAIPLLCVSCGTPQKPPALLHYEAVWEGMGVDEFAKAFPHELHCDPDLSTLRDARALVRRGGGRDFDGELLFVGLTDFDSRRSAFRFAGGRLSSKTEIYDQPGSAFFRAALKGISLAKAVTLAPPKLRMDLARQGQNPGLVKLPAEVRKLVGFTGRAFCVTTSGNVVTHSFIFTIRDRTVVEKSYHFREW